MYVVHGLHINAIAVNTGKVTQFSGNDEKKHTEKLEENAVAVAAVKSTRYSFRSATCAPD